MSSIGTWTTVASLLGGVAAIAYFGEKTHGWFSRDPLKRPTRDNIERLILRSDASADWATTQTTSKQITVYKPNPSLRFEMSNGPEGLQCDDFREPWANKHPDPKAVGLWCDLYLAETLIRRFILVGIDGVRALVPPPSKPDGIPGGCDIQSLQYKVAQIHDTLHSLDEYIERSRLRRK